MRRLQRLGAQAKSEGVLGGWLLFVSSFDGCRAGVCDGGAMCDVV